LDGHRVDIELSSIVSEMTPSYSGDEMVFEPSEDDLEYRESDWDNTV